MRDEVDGGRLIVALWPDIVAGQGDGLATRPAVAISEHTQYSRK